MSARWPASTGLEGAAGDVRRHAATIWLRQAAGIFRAARRTSLRPGVLAGRLTWIFVVQLVLATIVAIGLLQAGGPQGIQRVPPESGWLAVGVGFVLLLLHALPRLGAVGADVQRDADERVLEVYEASPLSASAYVAGRMGFHLTEQAIGFTALLPTFALAHAMRVFTLGDLLALALALLVVSLTHGLFAIRKVLGIHARRARGEALPPGRRAGTGVLVTQGLLGLAAAWLCFTFYLQGQAWTAPLLLAFSLTPIVPLFGASFDGFVVTLFGQAMGLWLPATLGLLLLTLHAWSGARLLWKPPARASGAESRFGFALAWLVPALALSGSLRGSAEEAAWPLILVAGFGALVLPAWAASGELADLGSRPAARSWGWLGARRATAPAWALSVHAIVLLLLGLLAPTLANVPRGAFLLLALVVWAGTAPMLLVTAGASRWVALKRGAAPAFFSVVGLLAALSLAALPQILSSVDQVPLLGPVARLLEGPAELAASASPMLLLPEAARAFLGSGVPDTWLRLPAGWSVGLPEWGIGLVMQAALGLPLAWLLHRAARRAGR